MRKELTVVKHKDGWIEFRVQDRHVLFLNRGTSFEDARLKAYEYVWDRPEHMWTIKGKVA